jgi:phage repressor protein C with HTH and peptisase S24 domain
MAKAAVIGEASELSEIEKFANRVRELAASVGGPKRLSECSGLSRAVIGKYLSGKSEPSRDRLIRLARAGNVSIGWLASGEGEMSGAADALVYPRRNNLRLLPPRSEPSDADQAADHLAFTRQWIREVLRADPERVALIMARGDSMAPTIIDGDALLIEVTEVPLKQDGLYVIIGPDSLVVRRLVKRIDGSLDVRCDSAVYGSERARPQAIKILGRVLWLGRRV